MTALAAEQDGQWRILAAHYSVPIAQEEAVARANEGTLVPPIELTTDVRAGAEPLAQAFAAAVSDPQARVAQLAGRPDAVVIGSGADERWTGPQARTGSLGAQATPAGGVRAGLAPSGTAGWVAGNARYAVIADGRELALPLRLLLLYIRDGGAWRLVSDHHSIALPD
jgi:hypothetical protein